MRTLMVFLGFFAMSVNSFAELMPSGRAQATLDDARFQSFYKNMSATFGGECELPAANAVDAVVKRVGKGDFASQYYTFKIVCNRALETGFKGITVTAEFSTLVPVPLNLDLTVNFKQ